jgi:hypothetical protein
MDGRHDLPAASTRHFEETIHRGAIAAAVQNFLTSFYPEIFERSMFVDEAMRFVMEAGEQHPHNT